MSTVTPAIEERIRGRARELGFCLVGICPAAQPPRYEAFLRWLEAGFYGDMFYLPHRREAYRHPRSILNGVRSLIMLGFPYRTQEPVTPRSGEGRVSRYAWGEDYHRLIRSRLKGLSRTILEHAPDAEVRGVVDTAPLLEKEFAQLAGLGWIGKNTLLISPLHGSWIFLAALLTSLELKSDIPFTANHCGSCDACLRACPTGALIAPYVLDARRCISYLTIEHRGEIPLELRPQVGDWLFGCDICQDVCPWNRKVSPQGHQSLYPNLGVNLPLLELFTWPEEKFRMVFAKTPLWRAKRRGLLRNAAIVLGNQRCVEAVPALARGLCDEDPIVREAAAWALAQIGSEEGLQYLACRLAEETDPWVRQRLVDYLAGAMNAEPGS